MAGDFSGPYLLIYMNVHPTQESVVDLLLTSVKTVQLENEKKTIQYYPIRTRLELASKGSHPHYLYLRKVQSCTRSCLD